MPSTRIRDGDDGDHFQPIFDEYIGSAARFFRRRGLAPDVAEDLAQESILRVYRGIEQFRWQSTFNTWVLRIMDNVYKSHRRHLATARNVAERESVDAVADAHARGELAALPEGMVSDRRDPEEATLSAERKIRVHAALAELPPRMRQCFLLRFEGFKYREIACMLDVQVDTVKKQLQEGKRRLRPILGALAGLFSIVFTTYLAWALTRWPGG